MTCSSKDPVVRFMYQHKWEWISHQDLMQKTGMPAVDVNAAVSRLKAMDMIEVSYDADRVEYRYIGNMSNKQRIVVEFLRKISPNPATGPQIASITGIQASAWIRCFTDILPIEEIRIHGMPVQYRYITNDRRSLMEKPARVPKPPTTKKAKTEQKKTKRPFGPCIDRDRLRNNIMIHLITTQDWYTAEQIVEVLGSNVYQVSSLLQSMRAANYPIETHRLEKERMMYHYTGG
ncbi:MAG TPA: hypothetical protein O0X27_06270, partial [Methanocorpusculum sp.]|nr:hypothetical protein [Methanocorpusculum sp.]